jgi:hypothetical protein
MTLLIVLIVAGTAGWLYKRYRDAKRRHQVRLGDPAPKAWIEVSLPYGAADAEKRTPNMLRKAISFTTDDPKARETGEGQIDIIAYLHVKPGDLAPTLLYLVGCDPQKMPMLKRAIKSAFGPPNSANIADRRSGDPFMDVIEWFREQELAAENDDQERDPDLLPQSGQQAA